ncbi:hypothetical protein ACE1B6_26975 [Aerosakkonemataceae cyanobacterium BLCC-F154]|uniref:Uncharacterized protein n=1 Tax=Floridaenema fluviatile BLCC-F154 TaxID=3153640 RepID=A0ABV4YJQ8_9CYAN
MIRKPSTKQAPKIVLDSDRLQALVTDLGETKEGIIVGGNYNRYASIELNYLVIENQETGSYGAIRATFRF